MTFRHLLTGLACGLFLTLSACGGSAPTPLTVSPPNQTPLLGPGDRIHVSVYGQDQLTVEAEIDGEGTITLPLVGHVVVSGQTPRMAEDTIAARLKPGIVLAPKVSVLVVHYKPIYVLGEVVKPGAYDYTGGIRVIDAIALASGYTYRALISNVTVRHARGDDDSPHSVTPTTPLQPGDVIEVPERWL